MPALYRLISAKNLPRISSICNQQSADRCSCACTSLNARPILNLHIPHRRMAGARVHALQLAIYIVSFSSSDIIDSFYTVYLYAVPKVVHLDSGTDTADFTLYHCLIVIASLMIPIPCVIQQAKQCVAVSGHSTPDTIAKYANVLANRMKKKSTPPSMSVMLARCHATTIAPSNGYE